MIRAERLDEPSMETRSAYWQIYIGRFVLPRTLMHDLAELDIKVRMGWLSIDHHTVVLIAEIASNRLLHPRLRVRR
jgi:hypothetical protein